jgi:hypothetical protein
MICEDLVAADFILHEAESANTGQAVDW